MYLCNGAYFSLQIKNKPHDGIDQCAFILELAIITNKGSSINFSLSTVSFLSRARLGFIHYIISSNGFSECRLYHELSSGIGTCLANLFYHLTSNMSWITLSTHELFIFNDCEIIVFLHLEKFFKCPKCMVCTSQVRDGAFYFAETSFKSLPHLS